MSNNPQIDEAVAELEQLADEIQIKLHLAGMDAKDTWNRRLEPRLFEVRGHAHDAKVATLTAVHDAVEAFKAFSASI